MSTLHSSQAGHFIDRRTVSRFSKPPSHELVPSKSQWHAYCWPVPQQSKRVPTRVPDHHNAIHKAVGSRVLGYFDDSGAVTSRLVSLHCHLASGLDIHYGYLDRTVDVPI